VGGGGAEAVYESSSKKQHGGSKKGTALRRTNPYMLIFKRKTADIVLGVGVNSQKKKVEGQSRKKLSRSETTGKMACWGSGGGAMTGSRDTSSDSL